MWNQGTSPKILQPTRFAGYSNPTLIDHTFCNYFNSNLLSGNPIPHITDHLPNFLIITELDVSLRTNAITYKRNYSQFNKNKFLKSIEALKLDDLISSKPTTDEKYNSFHDKLLETIDMHAPYANLLKRKIKQNAKPWITYGIRKSIRKKNKYYGLFIKRNDTSIFLKYKHRNKINHLIKLSKKNHYLNYFNRFKSNMKRMWQGIRCIMNVGNSSLRNETEEQTNLFH